MFEEPIAVPASEPAGALQTATRNVFALGAGELAARVIGFLSTVYIARTLGSDGYGIIGFAFTISLYAVAITEFGLEQHGPREVAARTGDLGVLIASVVAGRMVIALVAGGIMTIAGLFAPAPDGRVLTLFALVLFPAAANVRWVHFGLQRSGIASLARLMTEGIRLLVLVLTVSDVAHVTRVPLAQVAGEAAGALLLLAALRPSERSPLRVDVRLALSVFRSARPLVLSALLRFVIYNSDVIFLRFLRPVAETGLYLAAYAPINLLGVLGNVVAVSLIPAFTRSGRDAAGNGLYQAVTLQLARLAFPVAAGGFLLATPLIELGFGAEYREAGTVLAILVWAFPLLILRAIQQAALVAADANADVLRATAWAAGANVCLNIVVIPRFGMVGAAATTLAAEAVRLAVAVVYTRRIGFHFPAPARFGATALAVAAMAAGLLLTATWPIWVRLAIGATIFAVILLPSVPVPSAARWRFPRE